MPTRSTKRAAVSSLSAEKSMTVATDPNRYQRMLAEFATHQEAAVEAERLTSERNAAADAAAVIFCLLRIWRAVQFLPNFN